MRGGSGLNSQKNKILIVDDELDVCTVYQIALQEANFECISYTNEAKALQEFKPYFYDLILLDIKMPMINGFELCKKIRQIDNNTRIIFITASKEFYASFRKEHYPELSNIVLIQKPIKNEELVAIVNRVITTKDNS